MWYQTGNGRSLLDARRMAQMDFMDSSAVQPAFNLPSLYCLFATVSLLYQKRKNRPGNRKRHFYPFTNHSRSEQFVIRHSNYSSFEVIPEGLEPPTDRTGICYSIQLNYGTNAHSLERGCKISKFFDCTDCFFAIRCWILDYWITGYRI